MAGLFEMDRTAVGRWASESLLRLYLMEDILQQVETGHGMPTFDWLI